MDTPAGKRRHLNWYGQTLEDYQKPSCVYCLADLPHRAHVTALELEQLNLPVPRRPNSVHLQEICDRGGCDAIAARAAMEAEPAA